ncbi:flagellar protein FliT [Niallia sp. 03133]|uniref:flagellar protein FliT n=1 Tax=Niallia sp. 03133 TaxID=3458060 RepID=UPI004044EF45
MEAIKQCYQITADLIHLLKEEVNKEEFIQELDELLNQRQACLALLAAPQNEKEEKLGGVLLQQDQELLKLLHQEKGNVQQELKNLKIKKASNQKYVNPYQSLQIDGVFYDRRK